MREPERDGIRMQEEKFVPAGGNDMERLLSAMDNLKGHSFLPVDDSGFDDREIAEAFNDMLKSLMDQNNHFLMRINDAMFRIADNSLLKNILEQIRSQKEPIREMEEVSLSQSAFYAQRDELQTEALALARQSGNAMQPCIRKLQESALLSEESGEIMKTAADGANALLAELSAGAPKGREDDGAADSLRKLAAGCEQAREKQIQLQKRLKDAAEQISDLVDAMQTIRGNMNQICRDSGGSREQFASFTGDLKSITESYDALSEECFSLASFLHRISRDIDNARNDMYRHNSRPTMLDRLSIFAVDHLTLVWRLYNTIVEFESLKITQVNNPDRCKFGLWRNGVTDPGIQSIPAFLLAHDAHEELHAHAVSCILAKESSDEAEALKEFEMALDSYRRFYNALQELQEYLRGMGIADETEVWKYNISN